MSVATAIITTNNEGEKMESTLEIGQTYTTAQSGVVGIIKQIDSHESGVKRILLDVNGSERWTTAK
jgi:hypothetical protein